MLQALRPIPTLALGVLVFSASAQAHISGQFGRSGRTGSDCTGCHGTATPRPTATLALTPVNTVFPPVTVGFVPGARYTVTVSVSGGPALDFGFNADASDGTGIITQATSTRQNSTRLQEITHQTAGTTMSTWTYDWVAPATAVPVQFWLAVVSGNNSNSTSGDRVGTTTLTINPLAPEVLCRFGNVNGGQGIDHVVNVLTISGSPGDDLRRTTLAGGGPLSVQFAAYPGAPAQITYALYGLMRANAAADITAQPAGLGSACFSTPLSGGHPVVLFNTLGSDATYGAPMFRGTPPGPGTVFSVAHLPTRYTGRTVTMMGIVLDVNAPNGQGAITNAVVLTVQ